MSDLTLIPKQQYCKIRDYLDEAIAYLQPVMHTAHQETSDLRNERSRVYGRLFYEREKIKSDTMRECFSGEFTIVDPKKAVERLIEIRSGFEDNVSTDNVALENNLISSLKGLFHKMREAPTARITSATRGPIFSHINDAIRMVDTGLFKVTASRYKNKSGAVNYAESFKLLFEQALKRQADEKTFDENEAELIFQNQQLRQSQSRLSVKQEVSMWMRNTAIVADESPLDAAVNAALDSAAINSNPELKESFEGQSWLTRLNQGPPATITALIADLTRNHPGSILAKKYWDIWQKEHTLSDTKPAIDQSKLASPTKYTLQINLFGEPDNGAKLPTARQH